MLKDEINKIVIDAAEELGCLIYESSVRLKGENSNIVVKLDKLDGISHSDCEEYSKVLDRMLEDTEILPNYTLEISSPGLNRKLRSIEEIKRFIESPIKIIYINNENQEVVQGMIEEINDNIIIFNTEGKQLNINYDQVVDAFLDY